jgi:hypothetical protein
MITSYSTVGAPRPVVLSNGAASTLAGDSSSVYMESENHDLHELGKGDVGGPWTLHKNSVSWSSTYNPVRNFFGTWTGWNWYVDGPYPGQGGPSIPTADHDSDSRLAALGTTAIARCAPTNPYMNLTDAVAQQIGQPLPAVVGLPFWKERSSVAKAAGSEYLNLEFGWLPMIDDITRTARAIKNSGPILRDFLRGSGKKTREGYLFPEEISTTLWSGLHNTLGGNGGGGYPGTTTIRSKKATWFKGCFTYYVPDGSSQFEKMARAESLANHLLGTRLTPEVLWDATPWTWAADWFANTGDLLRNLSLFQHDGLVLQYGYVMQTAHVRTEHHVDSATFGYSHTVREDTWKVRRKATPYGFGVDLHMLNPMQISILTALGLTHGLLGHG